MSLRLSSPWVVPRSGDAPPELPAGVSSGCLTHALVVGGTAWWRREIAETLHRVSALRFAPLVRIDGYLDGSWLIRTLCGRPEFGPGVEQASAVTIGTLFVDRIEGLSPQAQALLLRAATCVPDGDDAWDWRPGRLIAGISSDPARAVRRGLLAASLYDALDKIRVERSLISDQPRCFALTHPLRTARADAGAPTRRADSPS